MIAKAIRVKLDGAPNVFYGYTVNVPWFGSLRNINYRKNSFLEQNNFLFYVSSPFWKNRFSSAYKL